jgi:hypothetical protein
MTFLLVNWIDLQIILFTSTIQASMLFELPLSKVVTSVAKSGKSSFIIEVMKETMSITKALSRFDIIPRSMPRVKSCSQQNS